MVTERKPPWERRTERLQVKIEPSLLAKLRAIAGPLGVGRFVRDAIWAALNKRGKK